MTDSYTYLGVCKPIRIHKNHPVGSEANESTWRLNTLFGGDEMVEWFKALNFLRIERCYFRFGSAKMFISVIYKKIFFGLCACTL